MWENFAAFDLGNFFDAGTYFMNFKSFSIGDIYLSAFLVFFVIKTLAFCPEVLDLKIEHKRI